MGFVSLSIANTPQRIALMLPLTGPLAQQGQAIRNGFFAAYYQAKANGIAPNVTVMDTNQTDINKLYDEAKRSGIELVVGPLQKIDIEKLISRQRLAIPILALNTIPATDRISNLYQFGLTPDDAAVQAAQKIYADSHQRILLIAPSNEWGTRIQTVFEPAFTKLGGKIIASVQYESRAELAGKIREMLALDKSAQRATALKWILKEKVRFTPYRRNDFDAIFVVATPTMGREILPLLRFYYVNNDVPIYSIAEIYTGSSNPQADHDLNGIVFDDMPWLFDSVKNMNSQIATIRTTCKTSWPDSFRLYPRFYALGADAFQLIFQLNQLATSKEYAVEGATGLLSVQANGQIFRKLIWARFTAGQPFLLDTD